MNETELEKILRHPPQPQPPAALKQRLTDTIPSRATATTTRDTSFGSWLRRWWPALAPAGASLACAGLMVTQQSELRELRAANEQMAQQISATAAGHDKTSAVTSPPVVLVGGEEQEIARLRERVAQLSSEIARLETLQNENASLRHQAAAAAGWSPEEQAAMQQANDRSLSIVCINNLKQIGLAVRIWSNDNKDVNPPNFLSISNELNTPKTLVCPADTNRVVATSFAAMSEANYSYDYLSPNVVQAEAEPQRVLTRCPVHGHIGLCDGSVQGEIAKKHPEWLILRDNKLYLDRAYNTLSQP